MMAAHVLLFLYCSYLRMINAVPSISSSAHSSRFNYYPPAEPNYPAINPFPKSAPLPPSEKATAILDVFNKRYSKTDVKGPTLRPSNSKSSKHWRSAEKEASTVHVSSVIHPDNFYPQNKHIEPNGPMPRDAFVISKDPLEAFVHSNSADDSALGPISNPAAYFLHGAHLDKVSKPKCQMFGCEGPLPNDGSIRFKLITKPLHSCYQAFVQLNTCVGDKGYPVGMVCTICCDCTNSFIAEMRNSRGYKIGFSRK